MGYFLTSLYFFNKTSASGQQADNYAKITEQADNILKKAYQMEAEAHGYIVTKDSSSYKKFKSLRCDLSDSFKNLENQELAKSLAEKHIKILSQLIKKRKIEINTLMKHDSLDHSLEEIHFSMISGGEIMDSISEVLMDIRKVSAKYRDENKNKVEESSNNTIFMLSIFGVVMILIVIISFNKMKTEILANELKNKEISDINRTLKSVNENLEKFAYVASHDLNEPLRKIRTFGELVNQGLDEKEIDKETIKLQVHKMQSASKRMQILLEDLLSYSRVNRKYDENEIIDLNKVLQETISDLDIRIKESGAEVRIGELPRELAADGVQMRQLFQNLISNGIKFAHPDRKPIVEVYSTLKTAKDVPQSVNTEDFKSFYEVTVKDNGIGFDNKYASTIFDVFKRLHGVSEYEGTGIGLSICKKIVDIHQGAIIAESKKDEGSLFRIFLPAEKNRS